MDFGAECLNNAPARSRRLIPSAEVFAVEGEWFIPTMSCLCYGEYIIRLENLVVPELLSTSETDKTEIGNVPGCNATQDIECLIGWARAELDLLALKRATIAKRVRAIRNALLGLAEIFGSDVTDAELQDLFSELPAPGTPRRSRGLTRVCRETLMESSQPITTGELCRRIQETNPELIARQKDPKISLTVVLRRLVNYGEVYDDIDENKSRTWLWIGPRTRDEKINDSSSSLPERGAATEMSPNVTA